MPLRTISLLDVPIVLEIGREPVAAEAEDCVLAHAADVLTEETFGDDESGEDVRRGRGQGH